MTPRNVHVTATLVGLLILGPACGRTDLGDSQARQDVGNSTDVAVDSGSDARVLPDGSLTGDIGIAADTRIGADAGIGADTGIAADTGAPTDDAGGPLRPAPDVGGSKRTGDVARLWCNLDDSHLVQAALRAGACLDLSVAGVLDDAERGFIAGPMLGSGYAPATFGNCEFLRCLSDARDCADARRCDRARRRGTCDPATDFHGRCDGTWLESCTWTGDDWTWMRTQDCARLDTTCIAPDCTGDGCPGTATCAGDAALDGCGYYGECNGNTLVRCLPEAPGTNTVRRVEVDCGEVSEGATCQYTPVGGEAPGPTCIQEVFPCVNAFGSGVSCESDGRLRLCVFGRNVSVDCTAYGYRRCVDDGFFATRCAD